MNLNVNDLVPNLEATVPEKLKDLQDAQIRFYHNFFSEIRWHLNGRLVWQMQAADSRMDQLMSELSRREQKGRDRTQLWILVFTGAGLIVGICQHHANTPPPTAPPAAATVAPATSPRASISPSATMKATKSDSSAMTARSPTQPQDQSPALSPTP